MVSASLSCFCPQSNCSNSSPVNPRRTLTLVSTAKAHQCLCPVCSHIFSLPTVQQQKQQLHPEDGRVCWKPTKGWKGCWRKGSRGMNMHSPFFFFSFGRWCYGRKGEIRYDQACVIHPHTHTPTLLLSLTMLQSSLLEHSVWLKKTAQTFHFKSNSIEQRRTVSLNVRLTLCCGARRFGGLLPEKLEEIGGDEGFSFSSRWDSVGLGSASIILTFIMFWFSELASAPVHQEPSLFLNASLCLYVYE